MADELLTGYGVYGAQVAGTLSRLISGTGETNIRCQGKDTSLNSEVESTNADVGVGLCRSSAEASVMGVKRRA